MPEVLIRKIIFLLVTLGAMTFMTARFVNDRTVEHLVKLRVPHDEVYKLAPDYTVVDAGKDFVKMIVSEKELAELKTRGYLIDIVIKDYGRYMDEIVAKGFYHTYAQVCESLNTWATRYPTICRLDTIGLSVRGQLIIGVRITDYPRVEELEPEIRIIGAMHGNEKIATEVTLYFAGWLVRNYASNSLVRYLVDNREFWIIPIYNVDGHIANTRSNANGVDLNRDCGYMNGQLSRSQGPWSQLENQLFRNHMEKNNVTLEYNFHSAATYVNYLWDFHPADPPDSGCIIALSVLYADTSGLREINGFDWYQVYSSLQDSDFGIFGTISTTIETPQPSSGSPEIDSICVRNMRALRTVSTRAGWGMRGVVRDSLTDQPLNARIEFTNPLRWSCYTDPDSGDFHKMLERGLYSIKVCANGYRPKIVSNINVPDTGFTWLDVMLSSDTTYRYPFKVAWTVYADSFERILPRSFYALGDSDGLYHSLGKSGEIAVDMGLTPLINGSGNDFRVLEGDDGAAESYRIYAANNWNGPWLLCGTGNGNTEFDIPASLASARYLRIIDDGDGSANSPTAGFDLDAVKPLRFSGMQEDYVISNLKSKILNLSISPNPFRNRTTIKFQNPNTKSQNKDVGQDFNLALKIYNASGRLVKSFNLGSLLLTWDGTDDTGYQLPAGVYFAELKTTGGSIRQKVVMLK